MENNPTTDRVMSIVTYTPRIALVVLTGALFAVGCNRQESAIRTYSAPKEAAAPPPSPMAMDAGGPTAQAAPPPVAQAAPPPSGGAGAANEAEPIRWTLPAGWKQAPGVGGMRYATLLVSTDDPKAELTVVPLGAAAGATLPNVQRWAGQLKLPAVTDAELGMYVTQTQVSGEQAQVVDMTGTAETGNPPVRLLAAVIPHEGQAWFFTLKASEPLVAAQKANFETFIHSIQFPTAGSAAAGATTPAASGAAGGADPHQGVADPHASVPQANSGPAQPYRLAGWKAPEGWAEQPGSNSMRVTSFRVGNGPQQAEVVISRIPQGQSGSMLDNLNRWRGQVGLGPIANQSEGGMQFGQVGGQPGMFVSYTGPAAAGGQPKELLVAMTIVGRDDWFIKLLGPKATVTAQQDAFKQFVNSLQFTPEPK